MKMRNIASLKRPTFKSLWLPAISILISSAVFAQAPHSLSIDQCYELARVNFPLIKQLALLEQTRAISLDNASKGTLPQILINGQASYQSEVTELPIKIPNSTVPTLSKDQYKLFAEINQPLTDALIIRQQKEWIKANTVSEEHKIEVELYKLKDRINQLYFGILLLDAQIGLTELLIKDIQVGLDKTNAAIANGVAIKSNADVLKAELLKAGQKITELKAGRKGFTEMLSMFVNFTITDKTVFQPPKTDKSNNEINRPELKLFETQKKNFDVQNKLIQVRNLPRVSLFLQSGFGRPALNMLKNEFNFYYIGGLRLNWNISGFYTFRNDKNFITASRNNLDVHKEIFLFNTNLQMIQQQVEIRKIEELLNSDREIIVLRNSIKTTANFQLENGSITANDYLSFVNAEDQARQNLILHEIQLLMTQYNLKTITGN